MIFVRLIVALASLYIYNFYLDKMNNLPPVKWLSNSSMTWILLNITGYILFFVVFGWPFYREAKMRTGDLKKIAFDMGFVFHDDTFQPEESLLQSPLLCRGYRQRFGPAMTGKHEEARVQLFEHTYSEPGQSPDRGDTDYCRVVAVFDTTELHIPEFVMISKGRGDRMLETLFKIGVIDFKDDSKFSKRYALSGPNQESIRELFIPELRSAISRSKKKWAAAGIDNKFILFADSEPDEQLNPDGFVDYFKKTWEIFNIIRSNRKGR